jgi:trans-aconitate methyltransferase
VLSFTTSGPAIDLYFGGPNAEDNEAEYDKVIAHRSSLETELDQPLTFERLDGKKACRIRCLRTEGGDVLDEDRDAILDWILSTMESFRAATQRVRALVATG